MGDLIVAAAGCCGFAYFVHAVMVRERVQSCLWESAWLFSMVVFVVHFAVDGASWAAVFFAFGLGAYGRDWFTALGEWGRERNRMVRDG